MINNIFVLLRILISVASVALILNSIKYNATYCDVRRRFLIYGGSGSLAIIGCLAMQLSSVSVWLESIVLLTMLVIAIVATFKLKKDMS